MTKLRGSRLRRVATGVAYAGGGVTAGIDFAFQVAAELCGEAVAKRLQLLLEYDPRPPFDITEANAPAALLAEIRTAAAPMLEERLRSSERAIARLRSRTAAPSEPARSETAR